MLELWQTQHRRQPWEKNSFAGMASSTETTGHQNVTPSMKIASKTGSTKRMQSSSFTTGTRYPDGRTPREEEDIGPRLAMFLLARSLSGRRGPHLHLQTVPKVRTQGESESTPHPPTHNGGALQTNCHERGGPTPSQQLGKTFYPGDL